MCFSDGSKKSYAVRVGYVPFIKVFGINVISHRFKQYRGFTYEYFPTGVEKLDIATHYYTRTETIGELENIGHWDIALVRMKISLQLQQFGIKNRMI